jgi:hypothetical protein
VRKASWVPQGGAPPAAGKGYGDLGTVAASDGDDDKENIMGMEDHLSLREGDEDAYNERAHGGEEDEIVDGGVEKVDIVVSEPEPADADVHGPPAGDEHDHLPEEKHEEEGLAGGADEDEEDRFSDLGDVDREEEDADARSLRRSSHGTTVITPAEEEEEAGHGEEEWSEHDGADGHRDDADDAASDWTEGDVGHGMAETEGAPAVPVATAS